MKQDESYFANGSNADTRPMSRAHRGPMPVAVGPHCARGKHSKCYKLTCSCDCHKATFLK